MVAVGSVLIPGDKAHLIYLWNTEDEQRAAAQHFSSTRWTKQIILEQVVSRHCTPTIPLRIVIHLHWWMELCTPHGTPISTRISHLSRKRCFSLPTPWNTPTAILILTFLGTETRTCGDALFKSTFGSSFCLLWFRPKLNTPILVASSLLRKAWSVTPAGRPFGYPIVLPTYAPLPAPGF